MWWWKREKKVSDRRKKNYASERKKRGHLVENHSVVFHKRTKYTYPHTQIHWRPFLDPLSLCKCWKNKKTKMSNDNSQHNNRFTYIHIFDLISFLAALTPTLFVSFKAKQIDSDKVAERIVWFLICLVFVCVFLFRFICCLILCSDVDHLKLSSSSVDIWCDVCRSIE